MTAKTFPLFKTHRLTHLYIASLGLVAILSGFGQLFIQRHLTNQKQQLDVIKQAEMQLIMNQQLSKSALALYFAANPQQRESCRRELEALVNGWVAPSEALKEDMLTAVSPGDVADLERKFANLEILFQDMMITGEELLHIKDATQDPQSMSPEQREKSNQLISKMLVDEHRFTQGLNDIKKQYELRLTESINRLKQTESALWALTLLILFLEGYLIFRPAIQQLETSFKELTSERDKSNKLLLNILPGPIADRLKESSTAIADHFNSVTVLFADIVGFTQLASQLAPQELVACLNQIFSQLDMLAEKYGLEKIKTIGDAYMAVAGLPNPRSDHAIAAAHMALEMQTVIQTISQTTGYPLAMRIGLHSGPVVAGVIGIKKFTYDLWGNTVNVASRMESHGQSGQIQVSDTTHTHLQEHFELVERGRVAIKGKGDMRTFWLKAPIGSPEIFVQESNPNPSSMSRLPKLTLQAFQR